MTEVVVLEPPKRQEQSLPSKVDKRQRTCLVLSAVLVFLVCVTVAVVLVILLARDGKESNEISVVTRTGGIIIGKTVKVADSKQPIYEFHNIPYAQPPLGSLRFKPPERYIVTNNSEVFNGTDDKKVQCIDGWTGAGTEDCLVLSVRTPNLSGRKDVMVWIHGGGLMSGFGMGRGYSFSAEVTEAVDVVTVNINYRLGFLGFASVRELWDTAAGVYANNGIRDMIATLDWVQDNIAAFGGNPNSVTIIGESGGATAVLALICSPLANNKFHAAIVQSPAPEMRFTHVEGDAFQRTYMTQLCPQATESARKQCLMDLPAEKFSARYVKSEAGAAYFMFPLQYTEAGEYGGLIMVDPVVVTVSPRDLKNSTFTPDRPLPIIMSTMEEENWQYIPKLSDQQLNDTITLLFKNLTSEPGMLDLAYKLYPGCGAGGVWSFLTTDMRATCPVNDVSQLMALSQNRTIYRLYVKHHSSILPAFHAYDSFAFFGHDSDWVYPQEKDTRFENLYRDMVKTFASLKKFENGWEKFPGFSMFYENSLSIVNVTSDKPQEYVCDELKKFDLVKYGVQNR